MDSETKGAAGFLRKHRKIVAIVSTALLLVACIFIALYSYPQPVEKTETPSKTNGNGGSVHPEPLVEPSIFANFTQTARQMFSRSLTYLSPPLILGLLVLAVVVAAAVVLYVALSRREVVQVPIDKPNGDKDQDISKDKPSASFFSENMGPLGVILLIVVLVILVVFGISRCRNGSAKSRQIVPEQIDSAKRRQIVPEQTDSAKRGTGDVRRTFPTPEEIGLKIDFPDNFDFGVDSPMKSLFRHYFPDIVSNNVQQLRVPFGLKNFGNICYLNAMTQCLAWMLPCLSEPLKATYKDLNEPRLDHDLIFNFASFIANLQEGELFDHAAFVKYKDVFLANNLVMGGAQDDPRIILSVISAELDGSTVLGKAIFDDLNMNVVNQRECLKCHDVVHGHTVPAPLLDVILPLEPFEIVDMQEGIEHFQEWTTSGDPAFCESCGQKTECKRKATCFPGPILAVAARKDFKEAPITGNYAAYPESFIVAGALFTLEAAVVHRSQVEGSGHIVAYVKVPNSNCWFYINDETLRLFKDTPEELKPNERCRISIAFYRQ